MTPTSTVTVPRRVYRVLVELTPVDRPLVASLNVEVSHVLMQPYQDETDLRIKSIRPYQGRSDGGCIGIYTPNISPSKLFMG